MLSNSSASARDSFNKRNLNLYVQKTWSYLPKNVPLNIKNKEDGKGKDSICVQ